MPDSVIIKQKKIDDGLIVCLSGEVDLVRSPQLRSELMTLLEPGIDRLIVDLADVPFMDSSGVATLVEVFQLQRKKSHKLILCNMQEKVKSIFEISRLDMVFTITDDLNGATQA